MSGKKRRRMERYPSRCPRCRSILMGDQIRTHRCEPLPAFTARPAKAITTLALKTALESLRSSATEVLGEDAKWSPARRPKESVPSSMRRQVSRKHIACGICQISFPPDVIDSHMVTCAIRAAKPSVPPYRSNDLPVESRSRSNTKVSNSKHQNQKVEPKGRASTQRSESRIPKSMRTNSISKSEKSKRPEEFERRLDVFRNTGNRFRDRGLFGSLPIEDDHGEESEP